jgi:hypothetical protein
MDNRERAARWRRKAVLCQTQGLRDDRAMHRAIVYNECAEELEGEARAAIEGGATSPMPEEKIPALVWLIRENAQGYLANTDDHAKGIFLTTLLAHGLVLREEIYGIVRAERVLEAAPREAHTISDGYNSSTEAVSESGSAGARQGPSERSGGAAPLPTALEALSAQIELARKQLAAIDKHGEPVSSVQINTDVLRALLGSG